MSDPAGTRTVLEKHRFNESALQQYLQEQLPGACSNMEIRQFHGGQSNPTFYIGTNEREYVLRKKPPGKLLPSAHAIDREYRIMNALEKSDIPVPKMHLFCEDETIIGTSFYLMDYIPGRVFTNPLIPEVTSEERVHIYTSMVNTLAKLHRFNWEKGGLSGFGKPENYFQRQIAIWSKQYIATKTNDSDEMDRLIEWLPNNIPDDQQTTIAHGDFRIGNLIFHPDKPEVIAVLDWELSTLGHPLSDLAFNCMTYHLPAGHEIAGGFIGSDLEKLNIPDEKSYIESYCRNTGRQTIENWDFYMAFSLFRTAAIMQGVYSRAIAGNASSSNAHLFGDTFTLVAKRASALIG